jgi:replication-associated recombination protein RarA
MDLLGHEAQKKEFHSLIKEGSLSHGYIFVGPERIGKKLFAQALARGLEFGEFEPTGEPPASDLKIISPDEGSIGIDAIREIQEFLWQKPIQSPRRTLIIDDAEALTDEAQNALLKIAEEPPASSLILIIASDPERLRPTLRSRFQKTFFSPVPVKEVEAWAKKELGLSAPEAKKVSVRTEGRPGLAYAIVKDEKFQLGLTRAEAFLTSAPLARKELLKELAEDEEFDFAAFLDSLVYAGREDVRKRPVFWRRVLELRREAASYNLNPRLQLTALSEFLL